MVIITYDPPMPPEAVMSGSSIAQLASASRLGSGVASSASAAPTDAGQRPQQPVIANDPADWPVSHVVVVIVVRVAKKARSLQSIILPCRGGAGMALVGCYTHGGVNSTFLPQIPVVQDPDALRHHRSAMRVLQWRGWKTTLVDAGGGSTSLIPVNGGGQRRYTDAESKDLDASRVLRDWSMSQVNVGSVLPSSADMWYVNGWPVTDQPARGLGAIQPVCLGGAGAPVGPFTADMIRMAEGTVGMGVMTPGRVCARWVVLRNHGTILTKLRIDLDVLDILVKVRAEKPSKAKGSGRTSRASPAQVPAPPDPVWRLVAFGSDVHPVLSARDGALVRVTSDGVTDDEDDVPVLPVVRRTRTQSRHADSLAGDDFDKSPPVVPRIPAGVAQPLAALGGMQCVEQGGVLYLEDNSTPLESLKVHEGLCAAADDLLEGLFVRGTSSLNVVIAAGSSVSILVMAQPPDLFVGENLYRSHCQVVKRGEVKGMMQPNLMNARSRLVIKYETAQLPVRRRGIHPLLMTLATMTRGGIWRRVRGTYSCVEAC